MKTIILLTLAVMLTGLSYAQEPPVTLLLTQVVIDEEDNIHEQIFALVGEELLEVAEGYDPILSTTGLIAYREFEYDDLIVLNPITGEHFFVADTSSGSRHFWSPDGSTLLYSVQDDYSSNLVLWTNGDVSQVFPLTDSIVLHGWYDNSTLLVDTCTGRANCVLSQFSIESGQSVPLTVEDYPKISVDVSPDGLIAYTSRDGLFILGNVESTLVDQLGGNSDWSPDGQKLVYLDWDGDIRLYDLQTGDNTRLVNGTRNESLGEPLWMGDVVIYTTQSPDGETILHSISPQEQLDSVLFPDYHPFRVVVPE